MRKAGKWQKVSGIWQNVIHNRWPENKQTNRQKTESDLERVNSIANYTSFKKCGKDQKNGSCRQNSNCSQRILTAHPCSFISSGIPHFSQTHTDQDAGTCVTEENVSSFMTLSRINIQSCFNLSCGLTSLFMG